MNIKVISLEELEVDGVIVGDALTKTIELGLSPEAVNQALYKWRDDFLRQKAEEIQEVKTSAEVSVASAQQETTAVRAMASEVCAKAEQALQEGDLDALALCIAEARKPASQREQEAIAAQIAELQAKLQLTA